MRDLFIERHSLRRACNVGIGNIGVDIEADGRNERDTEDLYEELSDRYGEPPEPVLYLLEVALLRALGERCKIISLTQEGRQVTIRPKEFDLDVWQEISDMPGVRLRVVIAEEPYLVLTMRPNDDPLAILCEIFKKYLKISGNKG